MSPAPLGSGAGELEDLEALLRRDPGGRGLAALAAPGLAAAARELLTARRAVVLSGFLVRRTPASDDLVPETDGPPGARALGAALAALGAEVRYLTDPGCAPLFQALGCAPLSVLDWVAGDPETPARARAALADWAPTHVVAIERPGRAADGRCWSMAAAELRVAALDELLLAARAAGVATVAIGDGGNEAGLGGLRALTVGLPHGERIATVVPADHALAAGVSTWGAYVLVAALSRLAGRDLLPSDEAARRDHEAIAAAGAVDGVSRAVGITVDGRPWEETLALLRDARACLGG
ncbi:MAG: glutamate cyclase domain-containing protein [Planctomycetota bacterium]